MGLLLLGDTKTISGHFGLSTCEGSSLDGDSWPTLALAEDALVLKDQRARQNGEGCNQRVLEHAPLSQPLASCRLRIKGFLCSHQTAARRCDQMMGGLVDAFRGGEPAADRFAIVVAFQLHAAAVQHQIELPAPEIQAGVGGHGESPSLSSLRST